MLAFVLFACGGAGEPHTTFSDYPNASLLVGTMWLADRLDEAALRVLDARDAAPYAEAHVPSAVSVPASELSSEIDGVPMEFDRAEV